jgi:hypothetical protein
LLLSRACFRFGSTGTKFNFDFYIYKLSKKPAIYRSSIKQKSKSISNFSYSLVPFEFEPNRTIDIVNIQFTDSDTYEIRSIEFGGNHVTEGMAYLCEQYQHKGILPEADTYPYKLISEIVKSSTLKSKMKMAC